jgi:hypothetical protein
MLQARARVAAVAIVLAGGLAACGGSSSSSTPSSASKADFCRSFVELERDDSPRAAADQLSEVGTPGDIDSRAEHGFHVLVDHLRALPDNAKESDITMMARGLSGPDQAAVTAFVTYVATECHGAPGDSSS